MLDELNDAIVEYGFKWANVVDACSDRTFFEGLQPTAVAWKVEDLSEFERRCTALTHKSDQVHWGWVNERWLATFHLQNGQLANGASIVKVMQRRRDSSDAVGLDHIDFYTSKDIKSVLQAEPNLRWTEETNGDQCKWVSVWFDGGEAKLRRDTVLQVCADELLEVQKSIL